jgi:signal peptidase II
MTRDMMSPRQARKSGGLLTAGILVADQVTKSIAHASLFENPQIIEVTGFFNLVPVWNHGVSFGMFADGSEMTRWLLTGFAAIVSIALIIWMLRGGSRFLVFSLALIIGGAIGNIIDRLWYGAVIDFVDLHVLGYHWPAFNLADSVICMGVVMLIIDNFRAPRHHDQT